MNLQDSSEIHHHQGPLPHTFLLPFGELFVGSLISDTKVELKTHGSRLLLNDTWL